MAPLFKYLLLVACIIPKYHSFVDSYRMYAEKSYEKKHKLVERASSGEISKSDSLLFIPCLTIRKDVRRDWDWYNTENNEKYASLQYHEYKRSGIPEFMVYKDNEFIKCFWSFENIYAKTPFNKNRRVLEVKNSVTKEVLEKATQYQPDAIFTIVNVPGYFFILGEKVEFFLISEQQLFHVEDALGFLKELYTEKYFPAVFSGQEL